MMSTEMLFLMHILVISCSGQRHEAASAALLESASGLKQLCELKAVEKQRINNTVGTCLDVTENFTPKLGSKETVDSKYLFCKPE